MSEITIDSSQLKKNDYIREELLTSGIEFQQDLFVKISISLTLITYWLFDDTSYQPQIKGLWLSDHTDNAKKILIIAEILHLQSYVADKDIVPSYMLLLPGVLNETTDFERYKIAFTKVKNKIKELRDID